MDARWKNRNCCGSHTRALGLKDGIPFVFLVELRRFMNANEHYVSQVLLRRFTTHGHLQRYNVGENNWKRVSPKNVFSHYGYNQLLVNGQVDHTLEQAFSKVETHLPKTFEALERAANSVSTELPVDVFENLCWYCAFIKGVSPFSKAAAPVDFIMQLDSDLERGVDEILRDELQFAESEIQLFRREHGLGKKIIIYSQGFLQSIYRIQFRRKYGFDFSMFRYHTKWTICHSPIEMPISDVALTEIPITAPDAVVYGLPIGPKLLLKGYVKRGSQHSSSETVIRGGTLTPEEAELWFEAICLSAVSELASKAVIPDVPAARARARVKGVAFTKIVDPDAVMKAGLKNFSEPLGLVVVSPEEYVKFVHSFIQPPDK